MIDTLGEKHHRHFSSSLVGPLDDHFFIRTLNARRAPEVGGKMLRIRETAYGDDVRHDCCCSYHRYTLHTRKNIDLMYKGHSSNENI